MPNSRSQESDYTCYACGETTPVRSWIIIDAAEKPDLIQRVKDGSIWEVTCSSCGESISPDLPLLLYFPEDTPRFLFVSRLSDGKGYPEIVIKGLFSDLVASSGDQELQDQYHHQQAWVLKEDLSDRLKDYPEVPLRDFDWSIYPALKQCEMLMPEEYFQMVMTDYFGTPDWNRRGMIVDRAPLLLTPAVEPWLDAQEEAFLELGNDQNVQIIREQRGILTRAREVGFYEAALEFQSEGKN